MKQLFIHHMDSSFIIMDKIYEFLEKEQIHLKWNTFFARNRIHSDRKGKNFLHMSRANSIRMILFHGGQTQSE